MNSVNLSEKSQSGEFSTSCRVFTRLRKYRLDKVLLEMSHKLSTSSI